MKEPGIKKDEDIMFARIINFDRIAQRYGHSLFEVPKIYTSQQLDFIFAMMREENDYEKQEMDRARSKK